MAGFEPVALAEIDSAACATLRQNRPHWNVLETDIRKLCAREYAGVDLVCAGVPCPPFSIAGRQLGEDDERNLFPDALRIVGEAKPQAVMFENVPGLASPKFSGVLDGVLLSLSKLGYAPVWRILNACDYGTPQLRPRLVIVALRPNAFGHYDWPAPLPSRKLVGDALLEEMASNGWEQAQRWAERANGVAPTLVGGSKKHGGPDLGPTRAREAWAKLGVDGLGVADAPPCKGFEGQPRLTVSMAARIQGFPPDWRITGKKTAAYRQVGNAFPPQVSYAVAQRIRMALEGAEQGQQHDKAPRRHVIATQEVLRLG